MRVTALSTQPQEVDVFLIHNGVRVHVVSRAQLMYYRRQCGVQWFTPDGIELPHTFAAEKLKEIIGYYI